MTSKRNDLMEILKKRHQNTVLEALGIEIETVESEVLVSLIVDKRHLQHAGIVHGGVFVLLAESAASIAGALVVDLNQYDVFGMEINANHLRPVSSGKISAKSKLIHKGRTSMVYGIEIRDEQNRLVSISRCTLAVRQKK